MDFMREIENLKMFDEAYFDGTPLIPDAQYDTLKKKLTDLNPNHPYFGQVGSDVRSGKVDLPYPMGSLDQIYEGDYAKWVDKYNLNGKSIVVSEKLDGVSIMLIYSKGKLQVAYSRGNGIQGADITRHIKNIPSVPKTLSVSGYMVVRAEGIMKDSIFNAKYSKEYRNARQMVAGCMNRKETNPKILKDISVVAYEIVDSSISGKMNKKYSLEILRNEGFLVAHYEVDIADKYSDAILKTKLADFRDSSDYELDGIVLTVNDYKHMETFSKRDSLNPEHSVKFKTLTEDSIIETEVVGVHWKISKSGFYKPRVEIKPVELFGTTVTFATGFNGKFIKDNEIGPGTIIKITKSGSVIPYILEVVKSTNADLPEENTWKWNDTGVEILGIGADVEVAIMQATHFFTTLEVENLKETSLRKVVGIYARGEDFFGIVKILLDLLDLEWERALGQNGIKIYESLHKNLRNLLPEKLLGATPFFGQGFGVRKAKKIMAQMSLNDFLMSTPATIADIEGFDKTSFVIYDGIEDFEEFLAVIKPYIRFVEKSQVEDSNDDLRGKVIVFTGFRDKKLQAEIESRGARVSSAVSGKTTTVVATDPNEQSSKLKKARDMNIEIVSRKNFLDLYCS